MPTKLTTIDTIQLSRLLDIAPRHAPHLAQEVLSGALSLEAA